MSTLKIEYQGKTITVDLIPDRTTSINCHGDTIEINQQSILVDVECEEQIKKEKTKYVVGENFLRSIEYNKTLPPRMIRTVSITEQDYKTVCKMIKQNPIFLEYLDEYMK